MRTDALFSEGSANYATARPQYPARLFDYLCSLCPDLDNAWDCATGTGQAAVSLAGRFAVVEATDVSSNQIANALKHERVRYSVQQAEETVFTDNSFSLVTVPQPLHWFDLLRFWPEVHRVLAPDGIFAAWVYTWPHVTGDIDRIIQDKLLNAIEGYWAPNNRLAWDGYEEIEFPFHEIDAPEIALSLDWDLNQFLSYLRTWSATRRCVNDRGQGFFQEFTEAIHEAWGNAECTKRVTMEFYCRVGRHDHQALRPHQ